MSDAPSVQTQYVATMLAFMTMRALSLNLAQEFVAAENDVPYALEAFRRNEKIALPDYGKLVRAKIAKALETLDSYATSTDVTDLLPSEYDRDAAMALALDQVQRAIELLTMAAFGE